MPLYRPQSPYNAAVSALGNAAGTASSMTRKTETKYEGPSKTLGGGLAAGLGGAWAGMQAAEYMEPGTNKALYHTLGDMFSAPANAAANAGAAQAMTTGAEAARAGIAQGIGGLGLGAEMSLSPAVAEAVSAGSAALQSAPVAAGAAQSMIPGGAAGVGLAGAGAAGSAGSLGLGTGLALSPAVTESVSAGLTAADAAASGATTGAAAGPVGAGVGALVGLTAGLLSYYL